jgi:hypothetical protein
MRRHRRGLTLQPTGQQERSKGNSCRAVPSRTLLEKSLRAAFLASAPPGVHVSTRKYGGE